jgi:hypothetical protein
MIKGNMEMESGILGKLVPYYGNQAIEAFAVSPYIIYVEAGNTCVYLKGKGTT